jgi:hypothetical protein
MNLLILSMIPSCDIWEDDFWVKSIDLVVSLVSGCVEVHDLFVLCPATNIGLLSVGETYLVIRPMMLV